MPLVAPLSSVLLQGSSMANLPFSDRISFHLTPNSMSPPSSLGSILSSPLPPPLFLPPPLPLPLPPPLGSPLPALTSPESLLVPLAATSVFLSNTPSSHKPPAKPPQASTRRQAPPHPSRIKSPDPPDFFRGDF